MHRKLTICLNLVSEVDIIFIYVYVTIHILILLATNFLVIFSSSFRIKLIFTIKYCIFIFFYNIVYMENEFGMGEYNMRESLTIFFY